MPHAQVAILGERSAEMSTTKGKTAFDWDLYGDRVKVLQHYRATQEYMDGILESGEGATFPVHLVVVSGLSAPFTEFMYKQNDFVEFNDDKVRLVKFPNISTCVLKILVDCSYTGNLFVDMNTVWQVAQVAQLYEMTEVTSACCSFLSHHVTVDNCMQVYQFGKSKRHSKLIQSSLQTMRRNIAAFAAYDEFYRFIDVIHLKSILAADDLNVDSEEHVWLIISRWINTDKDTRLGSLDYLMESIRFHRTDISFLESLSRDPLILTEKKRGRPATHVNRMIREKSRYTFARDNRSLPAVMEPMTARPRIPNEIVFAIGGWKAGRTTNLIETYDRFTDTWYEMKHDADRGPMHAYSGAEWFNNKIYFIGGTDGQNIKSSVVSFDPKIMEWKTLESMSTKRCYVATALFDGSIYAVGGHNGDHRLETVEKYDPEKNVWTQVASMNVARSDCCCVVLNGKIYAVGGLHENGIEASTECYDPLTDSWTIVAEMSTPRTSLAVVSLGGYMYALGGNRGDQRVNSVEKYDPTSNIWTRVASMKDKRSTFRACVLGGKIFVAGGYDGQQPFDRCESYEPHNDTWTSIQPMNNSRSGLSLIVVSGLSNAAHYTFCGNQRRHLLR